LQDYTDAGEAGSEADVVESAAWNAAASPNGAIWVFTGLLRDVDDDELAAVLEHELAHYSHKHTRRQVAKQYWVLVAATTSGAFINAMDPSATRTALAYAQWLTSSALNNHISRETEDQADRVGLRYTAEAAFDVRKAVIAWERRVTIAGDQNRVDNFFFGDHSTIAARIRHLQDEIRNNYSASPSASH
jgi:Zn-dependent protease with chaperone function